MLNVLDLFSGIGGFSLGLERTKGFRTVAFVEIDESCHRVLRKHWPEVPIHTNIRTLSKESVNESIDVICGGFPCQPHSVAGKQEGAADERNLWPDFLRCVKTWKPTWVVAENVLGLASTMLDIIVSDLEAEGYQVEVFCLAASFYGADHRRERLWIVAHDPRQRIQGVWPERFKFPQTLDGAFLPLRNRDGQWQIEPDVRRSAYGVSSRLDGRMNTWGQRLKQLGNAICPIFAEIFGYGILAVQHD